MLIRLTKEPAGNCHHQDIELEKVVAHVRSYGSAVIAFSGGTDSSVVAALAKRAFGDATVAVTVDNGVLHHGEVEHAAAVAREIGGVGLRIGLHIGRLPRRGQRRVDRLVHVSSRPWPSFRGSC